MFARRDNPVRAGLSREGCGMAEEGEGRKKEEYWRDRKGRREEREA